MSQTDPKRGETVRVWPTHPRVPSNSSGGAFIPLTGKNVPWSPWWAQRLRDGDVTLSAPANPALDSATAAQVEKSVRAVAPNSNPAPAPVAPTPTKGND